MGVFFVFAVTFLVAFVGIVVAIRRMNKPKRALANRGNARIKRLAYAVIGLIAIVRAISHATATADQVIQENTQVKQRLDATADSIR